MLACRQVCSLDDAKSDFEAVINIKPGHSQATKELQSLSEIQAAVTELEQMASAAAGGFDAAATQALLDRVYKTAPDCVVAQLLEAKMMMNQQKYEEVRIYSMIQAAAGC